MPLLNHMAEFIHAFLVVEQIEKRVRSNYIHGGRQRRISDQAGRFSESDSEPIAHMQ
ncbi:MAG: hypothetical protein GX991_06745 [Clostridiaceae bacterium]|nr:hypothetical protein [Clostridiaceae bacterium]